MRPVTPHGFYFAELFDETLRRQNNRAVITEYALGQRLGFCPTPPPFTGGSELHEPRRNDAQVPSSSPACTRYDKQTLGEDRSSITAAPQSADGPRTTTSTPDRSNLTEDETPSRSIRYPATAVPTLAPRRGFLPETARHDGGRNRPLPRKQDLGATSFDRPRDHERNQLVMRQRRRQKPPVLWTAGGNSLDHQAGIARAIVKPRSSAGSHRRPSAAPRQATSYGGLELGKQRVGIGRSRFPGSKPGVHIRQDRRPHCRGCMELPNGFCMARRPGPDTPQIFEAVPVSRRRPAFDPLRRRDWRAPEMMMPRASRHRGGDTGAWTKSDAFRQPLHARAIVTLATSSCDDFQTTASPSSSHKT